MIYRNPDKEKWVGIGVENPKHMHNVAVLFRTIVSLGLADFLFTVGDRYTRDLHADTSDSYKCVPVWNFPSFSNLLEMKPLGCDIVGIELTERSKPLEEFVHPKRAIYLLGNETHGLSQNARKSCRYLVNLPSPRGFSANVSSVGGILLWDRHLKGLK